MSLATDGAQGKSDPMFLPLTVRSWEQIVVTVIH